jgi:hypothetical protein
MLNFFYWMMPGKWGPGSAESRGVGAGIIVDDADKHESWGLGGNISLRMVIFGALLPGSTVSNRNEQE